MREGSKPIKGPTAATPAQAVKGILMGLITSRTRLRLVGEDMPQVLRYRGKPMVGQLLLPRAA